MAVVLTVNLSNVVSKDAGRGSDLQFHQNYLNNGQIDLDLNLQLAENTTIAIDICKES